MSKLFLAYQNAALEANNAENQDQGAKIKAQECANIGAGIGKNIRLHAPCVVRKGLIVIRLDHPRSRASRPKVVGSTKPWSVRNAHDLSAAWLNSLGQQLVTDIREVPAGPKVCDQFGGIRRQFSGRKRNGQEPIAALVAM
jgi:hypothetical protein